MKIYFRLHVEATSLMSRLPSALQSVGVEGKHGSELLLMTFQPALDNLLRAGIPQAATAAIRRSGYCRRSDTGHGERSNG